MSTNRALLAVVPAIAIAATACTANITTPTQTVTQGSAPAATSAASAASSAPPATVTEQAPAEPSTVVKTVAPASPTCGPGTAQEAFNAHIAEVPPPATNGPNSAWRMDTTGHGYEPCGALGWILYTNSGASAAAPYGIMLFYHGQYLGTATKKTYGFRPLITTESPERIDVTYKYPKAGESTAQASGMAQSKFTWDPAQHKIVHTGELPPD